MSPEAFAPLPKGAAIPITVSHTDSCSTCHFWRQGECRRYAPRPHSPKYQSAPIPAQAPRVSADFWCGEWERA